jgi:translation initiation factor eIF-2B subunit epsilon
MQLSTRTGAQLDDVDWTDVGSVSSLSRSSSSSSLAQSLDGTDGGASSDAAPAVRNVDLLADGSEKAFVAEARSSLERAFSEGHTVDDAAIELKTLRMASNVPLSRVRRVVVRYLARRVPLPKGASARELYESATKVVQRWGGLVSSVTEDEDAMVDGIVDLQQYFAEETTKADDEDSDGGAPVKMFALMLRAFYEEDVVSEDSIMEWWKAPESRRGGDEVRRVREGAKAFVQALAEAESDSESE